MIKPPPTSAPPPVSRRPARSWWSSNPEARAVQIGVVATILIHVLLLVMAPKIERYINRNDSTATPDEWASKEFQIELAPVEAETPPVVKLPQFVEANPNAPDNAPDKTDNVAAQNQQVAQEKPTPDGKSDAPATQGDPVMNSTAIVTGQRIEPAPAVPRQPPASAEPETPEQKAARRAQNPLPGSEKYEGDNPDGFGANVGKPAPNATPVPERVEGAADAKTDTGVPKSVYYNQVDAKHPQQRPTLSPDVVKARPTPLANREFGTENIGAVAYNAKWSAYGEYMQKFIESVDIQWQRIVEQSNVYPVAGTKVVVKFRINSKGEIAEVEPKSSGGRAAIASCVSAIVFRKSYGVWSDDMIAVLGESQEITFTFLYN